MEESVKNNYRRIYAIITALLLSVLASVTDDSTYLAVRMPAHQ